MDGDDLDWKPISKYDCYFKTHDLHRVSEDRLELRATTVARWMGVLIFPVMILALSPLIVSSIKEGDLFGVIFPLVVGSIVGTLCVLLVRQFTTPVTVDRSEGYYCKSRKKPEHRTRPSTIKGYHAIEEIECLQILSKVTNVNVMVYTSYELNLVLQDGTRHNIIDHRDAKSVRKAGQEIAELLDVELWVAN